MVNGVKEVRIEKEKQLEVIEVVLERVVWKEEKGLIHKSRF